MFPVRQLLLMIKGTHFEAERSLHKYIIIGTKSTIVLLHNVFIRSQDELIFSADNVVLNPKPARGAGDNFGLRKPNLYKLKIG